MRNTQFPTRGERNNNPGNIVRGSAQWQGMSSKQTDPRFIQFDTPVLGIRALAKILLNYQVLHGLNTISSIIKRWAPSIENDTAAYISSVAETTGFDAGQLLDLHNPETLESLTMAIIKHENGRIVYNESTIHIGVTGALS